MNWVKFSPALWYRFTRGMTNAEKGAYMDNSMDAVVDGVKGRTELADTMIAEAVLFRSKMSSAGKKGGVSSGESRKNRGKGSKASTKGSKASRRSSKASQKGSVASENEPIHTNIQTNIQTDTECSGDIRVCLGGAGGEPPTAPAHTPTDVSAPSDVPESVRAELEEAMRGAPLSVNEALDYAAGPYGGLTPQQVLAWAEWQAERQWSRDMGGTLHPMTKKTAEASMRRWRQGQADFDERARRGRGGAEKPVSDKGGIPGMEF